MWICSCLIKILCLIFLIIIFKKMMTVKTLRGRKRLAVPKVWRRQHYRPKNLLNMVIEEQASDMEVSSQESYQHEYPKD